MLDWKSAADAPVEEQAGFDDLPPGVWVAGATATQANGGAAPTVKLETTKSGENRGRKYYSFGVGLLTKGGDPGLKAEYKDRYMFFRSSVHPWEADEPGPKALLNGKLTGFINALFAAGTALDEKDKKVRAQIRWRATLDKLAEIEKAHPEIDGSNTRNEITGELDMGLAILQLVIAGIENDGRLILFKTGMSKARPGYESRVEIKQFEDCVPARMTERKVVLFDAAGVVVPTTGVVPAF